MDKRYTSEIEKPNPKKRKRFEDDDENENGLSGNITPLIFSKMNNDVENSLDDDIDDFSPNVSTPTFQNLSPLPNFDMSPLDVKFTPTPSVFDEDDFSDDLNINSNIDKEIQDFSSLVELEQEFERDLHSDVKHINQAETITIIDPETLPKISQPKINSNVIFSIFGELENDGYYDFQPRVKVLLENMRVVGDGKAKQNIKKNHNNGMDIDSTNTDSSDIIMETSPIYWTKKNTIIHVKIKLIGYKNTHISEKEVLQKFQLSIVGSGLPQTFMSKNAYYVFQDLIDSCAKEEGIIIQKFTNGDDVMEVLERTMVGNELEYKLKIKYGTNVSGFWRFINGYRLGICCDSLMFFSVPFKVLSRKPIKKKKKKNKKIKKKKKINVVHKKKSLRPIIISPTDVIISKSSENTSIFQIPMSGKRFLCSMIIQDSHKRKKIVEKPEENFCNWISLDKNVKIGYISIGKSGFHICANEQYGWRGNLILENQSFNVMGDPIKNSISVIVTIGSTAIKIVNKPRWCIIFREKNMIKQLILPSSSITIGRDSKFLPQDLSNENRCKISKLHLKISMKKSSSSRDILYMQDLSTNGTRIELPIVGVFKELEKYTLRFAKNRGSSKFVFSYAMQKVDVKDVTQEFEKTESLLPNTLIQDLKNFNISGD